MILILSKSKFEITTEIVLDWLIHFNQDYMRINGNDPIDLNDDFSKYTSIWFRSWVNEYETSVMNLVENIENTIKLDNNIRNENKIKSEYLFYKLKQAYWLTHPERMTVNKLVILDEAKKIGFKIPDTKLLNNKVELAKFRLKNKRIITKSMGNPLPLVGKNAQFIFYTKEVSAEHIQMLPETFPVSLFQELIKPKYEIRVFFINNTIFATAIFVIDEHTNSSDYRSERQNIRQVPYKLPNEIEAKIRIFLNNLNFNTASVDLIFGDDDQFYFLEINPVGQFGGVSDAGNYYLEKEIAVNLIKNDKKHN